MAIETFPYEVGLCPAGSDDVAETVTLLVSKDLPYCQLPTSMLQRLGYEADALRQFQRASGAIAELGICQIRLNVDGQLTWGVCAFAEEDCSWVLGWTALNVIGFEPDIESHSLRRVELRMLTPYLIGDRHS